MKGPGSGQDEDKSMMDDPRVMMLWQAPQRLFLLPLPSWSLPALRGTFFAPKEKRH